MVKKHKSSGVERHYKKNQKKHEYWHSFYSCCSKCKHYGRAGGFSRGHACFNKKSKNYMHILWHEQPSCSDLELRENV